MDSNSFTVTLNTAGASRDAKVVLLLVRLILLGKMPLTLIIATQNYTSVFVNRD